MIHQQPSPLAGQARTITSGPDEGCEVRVLDWFDWMTGQSWRTHHGQEAHRYAVIRANLRKPEFDPAKNPKIDPMIEPTEEMLLLPPDEEVLVGMVRRVNGEQVTLAQALIHVSQLAEASG